MKQLLILLSLLTFISAKAETYDINPKEDVGVSFISYGKILSAQVLMPNCPQGAMCDPATSVKVELTLKGCMDKLGPSSAQLDYDNETGKYNVLVSAINIHTKQSTYVRCVKAATATIDVTRMGILSNDIADYKLILLR